MVCTTGARNYYYVYANMVHIKCTTNALCVTLSSGSTVAKDLSVLHMCPRADPRFLERGFICINAWLFALLINLNFLKYRMKMK